MDHKLTFIINNNYSGDIEYTIKSIINSNERFLNIIKIIIVSDNDKDIKILEVINELRKIYNLDLSIEYDKENFFKIVNKLLDNISTEFITFSQGGYIYPTKFVEILLENFNHKYDEIGIAHIKNTIDEDQCEIVNLETIDTKISFEFWGTVFKTELIKNNRFNEKYNNISGEDLFYKVLLQRKKYLLIEHNEKQIIEGKSFYNEDLKDYMYVEYFKYIKNELIPYIEKNMSTVPRYMQYIFFDIIKTRFSHNLNNRNKHIVDDNLDEFLDLCSFILNYISDDIILNQQSLKNNKISKELKLILIKIKYRESFKPFYIQKNKSLLMCFNENFLLDVTKERVRIDAIEYENNVLVIDLSLFGFIDMNKFNVICKLDGESLNIEETYRYVHTKYFGKVLIKRHTYRIKINKNQISNDSQIEFFLKWENKQYVIGIEASRYTARITSHLSKSYWKFDDYIMSMPTKKMIKIERKKLSKCIEKEFFMMLTCLKRSPKTFLLRLLYYMNYPILKNKNIWLTYDKLYKGGDNGEYFYKYIMQQKDGICGQYVINKKYPDASRLKNEGYKPLKYGSIRHKLYFLYANIIATTHGGVYNFNGFDNKEILYFQDLLKSSVVCIQHGLTVQDLSFNSNRLFNNMKRYYCASKYEIENLSKPIYGYEDKSILKLTGIPRYDGLKNNDKKQILITPTWRNYIALPVSKKEERKPYYPGFKDTDYFKIYNKLISDKKLIETAKETGYKIIYLLHPVVSAQIDDYEKNENIIIVPATEVNYEKILTESSLMVTDYSGVQFDFAYMRKPIVYYHHPKLPPHYKESGFSYEEEGFGEICYNNSCLIDTLCKYMRNNCQMTPFYKQRANDFFEFSDFENCKRIYDDLKDYQREKI